MNMNTKANYFSIASHQSGLLTTYNLAGLLYHKNIMQHTINNLIVDNESNKNKVTLKQFKTQISLL